MSYKEISKDSECSIATVRKKMDKFGIKSGYLNKVNNDVNKVFTYQFLSQQVKFKSNKQIAKENNCAISTVRKYLKKFNLKCFNPTNKGRIAPNKKYQIQLDRIVLNRDNPQGTLERRYHNVIRKHIGREVDTKIQVVHHLDRNPKNDVIDNLILMNKLDHDRLHMILRNKHMYSCTLNQAIDYLFKEKSTNELKRYAELTRIIPSTEKCKK